MDDKKMIDIREQVIRLADQIELLSDQVERISVMLMAGGLQKKFQDATINLQFERLSAEIQRLKGV